MTMTKEETMTDKQKHKMLEIVARIRQSVETSDMIAAQRYINHALTAIQNEIRREAGVVIVN